LFVTGPADRATTPPTPISPSSFDDVDGSANTLSGARAASFGPPSGGAGMLAKLSSLGSTFESASALPEQPASAPSDARESRASDDAPSDGWIRMRQAMPHRSERGQVLAPTLAGATRAVDTRAPSTAQRRSRER
jgi:hypothetical protein